MMTRKIYPGRVVANFDTRIYFCQENLIFFHQISHLTFLHCNLNMRSRQALV